MVNLADMCRNIQHAAGILEEIEKARLAATRTTVLPDGLPHARRADSKVETGAVKVVTLEEQHAALLEQIERDKAELSELISGLEDIDQRAIMRLRYLNGHKPEDIADAIGLSIRSVYYKLDGGKAELEKLYPDRFTVGLH